MERGVILACRPLLAPEDLPPALQPGGSGPAGRPRTGRSGEERDRAVRAALDETGWNVSKAARRLGISRRQLHRIIAGLGLSRPSEPT
ncbi:hypothetical protein FJY71_05325 [candidate division WOR-3 bacterium]|nr:hypothetical protein [candidate division WOR-3 bacterium]